jgi:hypothetical protein
MQKFKRNDFLKRKKYSKNFHMLHREFPRLTSLLVNDLKKIDGYSDVEIGFGTDIELDLIRKIAMGDIRHVSRQNFFKILGLYSRVFCKWSKLKEDVI